MQQNHEPDIECWLTAPQIHAATTKSTETEALIARIRTTTAGDHRSALHELRHAEHMLLLHNATLTSRQRSYAWYWLGHLATILTQWRTAYQALLRSSHDVCTTDHVPWLLIQAKLGAAALQCNHFVQSLSSFTSVIEHLDQLFISDNVLTYQHRAAMRHAAQQGLACALNRLGIAEPSVGVDIMLPTTTNCIDTWLDDPTPVVTVS